MSDSESNDESEDRYVAPAPKRVKQEKIKEEKQFYKRLRDISGPKRRKAVHRAMQKYYRDPFYQIDDIAIKIVRKLNISTITYNKNKIKKLMNNWVTENVSDSDGDESDDESTDSKKRVLRDIQKKKVIVPKPVNSEEAPKEKPESVPVQNEPAEVSKKDNGDKPGAKNSEAAPVQEKPAQVNIANSVVAPVQEKPAQVNIANSVVAPVQEKPAQVKIANPEVAPVQEKPAQVKIANPEVAPIQEKPVQVKIAISEKQVPLIDLTVEIKKEIKEELITIDEDMPCVSDQKGATAQSTPIPKGLPGYPYPVYGFNPSVPYYPDAYYHPYYPPNPYMDPTIYPPYMMPYDYPYFYNPYQQYAPSDHLPNYPVDQDSTQNPKLANDMVNQPAINDVPAPSDANNASVDANAKEVPAAPPQQEAKKES